MFKKFSGLPDPEERLEIYNLLKFNLALGRRLAEFMTLAIMATGLGWHLARLFEPAGRPLAAAFGLGLLLLAAALPRWLGLALESALKADFGLDPRPRSKRLKVMAARELRWFAPAWALSGALYWGLTALNLWLWTLAALGLGTALLLLDAFQPRLLRPRRLRPLTADELDPRLQSSFQRWAQRAGIKEPVLRVAEGFAPELQPPRLTGLGSTLTLVIEEKALASFTPRELALLTVAALVEGLIKAPWKFFFLRLCGLAVAGPLAALFLSILGASLWRYPLSFNPGLITLVWLAAWIGLVLSDFAARLTRRDLEIQLVAAAAAILKDEEAVGSALATLAAKNLEEASPPGWRELFGRRFSRPAFLKRFKGKRTLFKTAAGSPGDAAQPR